MMEAPKEIKHAMDLPFLRAIGADVNEPEFLTDYWQVRNIYSRHFNGMLPQGAMVDLVRRQELRKAKPDRMAAARAAKAKKQLASAG